MAPRQVYWKIPNPVQRRHYADRAYEIARKIKESNIDTVVVADASGQFAAYLVKHAWRKSSPGEKMPRFYALGTAIKELRHLREDRFVSNAKEAEGAIRKNAPSLLAGIGKKKILVLDDWHRTGDTLGIATRVLNGLGAERIVADALIHQSAAQRGYGPRNDNPGWHRLRSRDLVSARRHAGSAGYEAKRTEILGELAQWRRELREIIKRNPPRNEK